MEVSELVEIEHIKQLKARYFRFMDTKDWDRWGEVFTDSATLQYGPDPGEVFEGKTAIVNGLSDILKDSVTVHHGHMPEIEIIGPTTATGVWAMEDFVDMPELSLKGYGHYEEEYIKENGQWKIAKLRLTRLRVDINADGQE